jgi:hypothetical protein
LVDLLDEAVNRMEEQLKGRIGEGKANITLEEVHGVAEAIGYGAIKYYDLRRNPNSPNGVHVRSNVDTMVTCTCCTLACVWKVSRRGAKADFSGCSLNQKSGVEISLIIRRNGV